MKVFVSMALTDGPRRTTSFRWQIVNMESNRLTEKSIKEISESLRTELVCDELVILSINKLDE